MAELSDIISVTITVQDAAVSQAGFGTPAILGRTSAFADLAREYTSVSAMIDDGFTATDPAVLAASAIFAQQPSPPKVVFLRQTSTAQVQTIELTPIAKNSTVYTVTINGTDFSYTSDASATVEEIATGLTTAINGGSVPVTATDDTGSLTLAADVAGNIFTLVVDRSLILQDDETTAAGVVADLTAARAVNDDWYALQMTSNATADTVAMAAHIETLRRLLFASSADDDIPADGAGNLAETLKTAGYNRTVLLYHTKPHQYPAAALAGKVLPNQPGSVTWMFKNLSGVDSVKLSATEASAIIANDANTYEPVGGVAITREGTASSGRYIDVTRTVDKLYARLQENLYSLLVNSKKVPFTDAGVAMVEAQVRATLQELVGTGALSPDFTVTVPAVADVSTANKAGRILPDVNFSATLAGAVHKILIEGTVSV